MKVHAWLATLTVLLLSAREVLGLGADHPKGPVAPNGVWPSELVALFNRPERVHGFFVNETDVFFYAGDTQALNQFLEAYARMPGAPKKVILHAGAKNARSPWDKEDRNLPIQWSLQSRIGGENADKPGRLATHVDLWLDNRIRLDQLRIPANLEAVSGGEIERFLADREKQKK